MGITRNSGLLDITLQTERLEAGELEELLSSYRRRRKYYRLKNGDFLELEDNGAVSGGRAGPRLELSAGSWRRAISGSGIPILLFRPGSAGNEGIVEVKAQFIL